MEDFEKLLEDYLDFESDETDFKENECNHKHKVNSPFTSEDSISIDKFVKVFLGYQFDCTKLYHSGLRELKLDNVIGIDNNFANKNMEYVKKGYLLIVVDAKKKRGTYLNPVYINKYLEKDLTLKNYNTFLKIQQVELEKIDVYYRKYLDALRAYNEIERFKSIIEQTRKVNAIKQLERRKNYDKYKR